MQRSNRTNLREVGIMSLKKNIFANYISQIYVTVIGIVIVPLYLKYMGAEAYGLVGFFAMLQAWFNLLDMGLTPTMARETARFRGGGLDALTFRRLVRALEGIFCIIAVLGGGVLLLLSGQIATNWLTAKQLPISEVLRSIQVMAIIISLRWMSGLYRGQISGAERLVWLSCFNAIIGTFRFVGVLPVLILLGATTKVFFVYQLLVALVELIMLVVMSYSLLPSIPEGEKVVWSWKPLKPILKFSLTIAFTGSVWVMVTQTDKLLLSKILSLAEYGYFTLAVLVANGVMIISSPVSSALAPRMTKLEAECDQAGLIQVYRQSTQMVAIISGAAAVTVSLCAESFLFAWTGDKILASHAAPVLVLYAIGNGILAVSAFPFCLQYAKGNLKLHMIGNGLFVIFLIPTIVWATTKYGSLGAGYTWLTMNIIYFIAWVPLVHAKFAPGLNNNWFLKDVFMIYITTAISGCLLNGLIPRSDNRYYMMVNVIIMGCLLLLSGAIASSFFRQKAIFWFKKSLDT